ncbi:MAG: acetate uptake transporter [Thermoplasmata archaeon]|nr:acetate uptake transporter [Thermoplasmata archaeon]
MGNVNEMKFRLADPAPLGIFGLAMATLVASSEKLGLTEGTAGILPWVIFLGAFAQIIACGIEFKRENIFAATAFGAFGLFWFAVGMTWYFGYSIEQFGFGILGYLIFSIYMTYAAASVNKAFLVIFIFIDLLLAALLFQIFGGGPAMLSGAMEMAVAVSGFYASAAIVLKTMAGFEVLPLGKPILELKKFEL